MVDRQGRDRAATTGQGGEGNQLALGITHRQQIQVGWTVLGIQANPQNHRILAIGAIDRGDLLVAIGTAQGRLHGAGINAQAGGPVAIDGDLKLGVVGLQVAAHIRKAWEAAQALLKRGGCFE